jgi:hypothetical protein
MLQGLVNPLAYPLLLHMDHGEVTEVPVINNANQVTGKEKGKENHEENHESFPIPEEIPKVLFCL